MRAFYRIEPAATLGSLSCTPRRATCAVTAGRRPGPGRGRRTGQLRREDPHPGAELRGRQRGSAAKVTCDGAGTGELRLQRRAGHVRRGRRRGRRRACACPPSPTRPRAAPTPWTATSRVEGGLDGPDGASWGRVVRRHRPGRGHHRQAQPRPVARPGVEAGADRADPAARRADRRAGRARSRSAGARRSRTPRASSPTSVGGAFGLGRSTIKDLSLGVRGVSWLGSGRARSRSA